MKNFWKHAGLAFFLVQTFSSSALYAETMLRPGSAPGPSQTEDVDPEVEDARAEKNDTRISLIRIAPTIGQNSYSSFDLGLKVGIDSVWQATGFGRVTNA